MNNPIRHSFPNRSVEVFREVFSGLGFNAWGVGHVGGEKKKGGGGANGREKERWLEWEMVAMGIVCLFVFFVFETEKNGNKIKAKKFVLLKLGVFFYLGGSSWKREESFPFLDEGGVLFCFVFFSFVFKMFLVVDSQEGREGARND